MLECKDIRPLLAEYAGGTLDEETAAQDVENFVVTLEKEGLLEHE